MSSTSNSQRSTRPKDCGGASSNHPPHQLFCSIGSYLRFKSTTRHSRKRTARRVLAAEALQSSLQSRIHILRHHRIQRLPSVHRVQGRSTSPPNGSLLLCHLVSRVRQRQDCREVAHRCRAITRTGHTRSLNIYTMPRLRIASRSLL